MNIFRSLLLPYTACSIRGLATWTSERRAASSNGKYQNGDEHGTQAAARRITRRACCTRLRTRAPLTPRLTARWHTHAAALRHYHCATTRLSSPLRSSETSLDLGVAWASVARNSLFYTWRRVRATSGRDMLRRGGWASASMLYLYRGGGVSLCILSTHA